MTTVFIGATVWPYTDPNGPVVVLPEADAPLRAAGYIAIPEDALDRVARVIETNHPSVSMSRHRKLASAILEALAEAKVVTTKGADALSAEHRVRVLRTYQGVATDTVTLEVTADLAEQLSYGDRVTLVVPEP